MKKPTAISKVDIKFGDIVVVPFPYADKLAEKRRPALVISSDAFNSRQSLIWVAMITSAENKSWADDIDLPLEGSGLSSKSVIRVCKLATVEAGRIVRIIGKIDKKTAGRISVLISENIGKSKAT